MDGRGRRQQGLEKMEKMEGIARMEWGMYKMERVEGIGFCSISSGIEERLQYRRLLSSLRWQLNSAQTVMHECERTCAPLQRLN